MKRQDFSEIKMKMKKHEFSEIVSMGWPIVAELLLIAVIANGNQYVWNRFSSDAVATIGSCNQIFSLAANAYGIISVGGSILLAPALGAHKHREIPELITTLITLTILAGVVFGIVGICGIPLCTWLLHIPGELQGMTKQYLQIVLGLSVFQGFLTTLTAVFRSMGRMKLVMVNDVLVNAMTLLLNAAVLFLIPGKKQTMTLYTMNSIYSQIAGCGILLWVLKKEGYFGNSMNLIRIRKSCRRQLFRILHFGVPAGMEGIIYLIGQVLVVGFVGMLGKESMMVRAYVLTVTTYMGIMVNVMTTVSSPMVGRAVGEGDPERVVRTVRRMVRYSFCGTVLCCLVFFLISYPFLRIYTQDPKILRMAMELVVMNVVFYLAQSLAAPWFAIMKAVGEVQYVFLVCLLGTAANIMVSYGFGIIAGWGLNGIWLGYISDFLIKTIFSVVRFRKGLWKNVQIV